MIIAMWDKLTGLMWRSLNQFQVVISKDKTVFKYGKEITLSCQVKGYPIPVIRWYKNNTPLPKSSR